MLRSSWRTVRGSRLGTMGLFIVIIFAAVAILAPVIAPYSRNFLAPDADRYVVSSYTKMLPSNLTYGEPAIGPSTPLQNSRGGGIWEVNFNASRGFIEMDFLHVVTVNANVSPYVVGNISLTFYDLSQDFNISPPIQPPLVAVYYIVPGQNATGGSGSPQRNGALAFFSGSDFAVVDPFTGQLIYRYRMPFVPTWTGEDPASAGGMLLSPNQRVVSQGVLTFDVGPYHYFYASDGNHTIVFETVFVHTGNPVQAGAVYPSAPGGQVALDVAAPLSAPPFVYYNQGQVDTLNAFRSGTGQGILLPLANNSLEVYSVAGQLEKWLPLSLGNESAQVSGPIGYTISPEFPFWLYLSLQSASSSGLAFFDMGSLSVLRTYTLPGSTWEPTQAPLSYRASTIFASFYNRVNDTSYMFAVNATGAPIRQFQANFPGRTRSFFDIEGLNRVYLYAGNGRVYFMDTTFSTSAAVVPDQFGLVLPPGVQQIHYLGSMLGTLYGVSLSNYEVGGVYTDPVTGETGVFQLLGTVHTPLPPGCYPSGLCYWLGTDFYGGDILTELLWGTQVAFIVGLLAALIAVGLGTLVGLISGYYGKLVDILLMRTTDIFLVLPFLPIVLIFVSILRPSIWIIVLTLAIVGWPGIARVIRAQVLSLKERPFIDAARISGASDSRIIFRHIAPNVLPFSFLYMSLTVAGAIITEAALSFLGLGDPTVISWGGMLSLLLTEGAALYAWWWLLPPGLCITILSLGFYLLGRGFDEIINPRLRRR